MTPAARVVPDVASFSVDDGFWYSIPAHLDPELHVGSIVRVPLSGRRVRGWVVERSDGREGNLKEISGISGSGPVFDESLLSSLMWTARHYVAPVSTLLNRASPPNLPRKTPEKADVPAVQPVGGPVEQLVQKTAEGGRIPVMALVGNWQKLEWLGDLGPVFGAGRSALVVAASAAEVARIAEAASELWGSVVAVAKGDDDKTETAAWESSQSPPRLLIGTPKTASWQIRSLGLAIVLEEGRRAMKDRQTPTLHVREVLRTRSRLEGFNLVFYGPTPSVEILSAGGEVSHIGNRAWPLVEVIDRSEEQPGQGFLSERVIAAIRATSRSGGRVFVFTHRRMGYASMRCTRCRTLRSCGKCGTRIGRADLCPSCGAAVGACSNCGGDRFEELGTIPDRLVGEINRKLGRGAAVVHPGQGQVTVGTERDLAGLSRVSLAVAADVDGILMGVGYRTSEEALRQLARLALAVKTGSGARLMLQTSRPDSLLITTLRRGDPIPYLERVLIERARDAAPPSAEMIVVEIRGDTPESAERDLSSLAGAVVLGPMTIEDGQRWLLTGELGEARLALRKLVGRWRDSGATVRIDVDPIDV